MLRLLIIFLIFPCAGLFAQDDGYYPYNKRRLGTMLEQTHELVGLASVGLPDEPDSLLQGNIAPGKSYGFGLGYGYRILVSDCPWSAGIGIRAQCFPGMYYSFGALLEADFFGWGGKNWSLFGLTEYNIHLLKDLDSDEQQWNFQFSMLELNVYDFSLQFFVQDGIDGLNETLEMNLDDSYWAFRLSYYCRL